MANTHKYSVVPPSAVFQENWPSTGVITQGIHGALSVAGWTSGNEGFQHQTFLGASIRSFNVNAGFGDSSSTMGIELVNDEFNTSDDFGLGIGDDVYHNGLHDDFSPPVVGSPVFFKFGKNFATTEQAFRKDFDQIYNYNTLVMPDYPFPISTLDSPIEKHPEGFYLLSEDKENEEAKWIDKSALRKLNTKWRGFAHFTFGGILQSYTETRSSAGNPLYSVKLVDPREILANTELILNNYAGTTFNNKNLYNIYGFLEYDPSDKLVDELENSMLPPLVGKQVLTKNVDNAGNVTYTGTDVYEFLNPFNGFAGPHDEFPITGQGFARRSENGIPWYRVHQAMRALFSYDFDLPQEYKDAGFGGVIDFRGYNYVVDWSGIPTDEIPLTYYLDFDQLNMLDLAQELCDVLSRELFVSLLPVIDHPACARLHQINQDVLEKAEDLSEEDRDVLLGTELIHGIIRIDTIDKKDPPKYGAVKEYLDNLEVNDVFVESRDVGFEVSNVVTDKFIAGAQEVDMYYFNTLRDRDDYLERLKDTGDAKAKQRLEQMNHDKWTLDTNLKQQVLPFYGFIGDRAVSIPRGFGSYQQILLDTQGLDAHGVGSYYVATEMELRAASVSYKQWQNFLLTYNEIYIQELSENQGFFAQISADLTEVVAGINDQLDDDAEIKKQLDILTKGGRNFGVSVPRSVWNSDQGFNGAMGNDGYPSSPCNPPFGYPLYYKRAEKIGIPQAGLTKITGSLQTIITSIETLENQRRSDQQRFSFVKSTAENSKGRIRSVIKQLIENRENSTEVQKIDAINDKIKTLRDRIVEIEKNVVKEGEEIKKIRDNKNVHIGQLKKVVKGSAGLIKNIGRNQRDSLKNAKKVHSFIKKVADDNLGKKFLVKIPKACNVNWSAKIKKKNDRPWDVIRGPFGFKPQPISSKPDFEGGFEWVQKLREFKTVAKEAERKGPTSIAAGASIWNSRSNAHWHYLDTDAMGQAAADKGALNLVHYGDGYTFGALKCNYNPMTEKWEYNYNPEPQGGFFNHALFNKNLKKSEMLAAGVNDSKLPKITRNVLAPQLMDKITSNSNRIQCYVRYDHSQHLDFSSISADSVEQQSIGGDGRSFIPDVMETLPNLHPDKKETLNQIQARLEDDKDFDRQAESVAFVKCELDSEFYMAPKTTGGDAVVWAEDFTVNLTPSPYEVVYVKDEDPTSDTFGCKIPKEVKRRPIVSFGVKNGGLLDDGGKEVDDIDDAHKVTWDDFEREYSPTYKGHIIKTKEKDLDPDHVYALITVPGRVIPTQDKRYVDGPMRAMNGAAIANAMTEDVVKIAEFKKPGIDNPADPVVDCANLPEGVDFTFEDISRAVQAQKDAAKGINLANGNSSVLAFSSPSPVYPDVVALPLMSMERCYGPWVSSALEGEGGERFADIGGKIEFQKDESLAPWSYAGYQLMDQAAKMKAQFSNSLLLFSERGSFTYADAPLDVSLAKALRDKGPLVTSISVDVGQSVRTSVKLDLYTSQFGKLQKQKEIAIAQISRERQKIIDQNNLLRRRGIGKGSANMNMMGTWLDKGGQKILDVARANQELFTALEKGEADPATMFTISATHDKQVFDGSTPALSFLQVTSEGAIGSMQSEAQVNETASLIRNETDRRKAMEQTAGGHITDNMRGYSDNPNDQYFASTKPNNIIQNNNRAFG